MSDAGGLEGRARALVLPTTLIAVAALGALVYLKRVSEPLVIVAAGSVGLGLHTGVHA